MIRRSFCIVAASIAVATSAFAHVPPRSRIDHGVRQGRFPATTEETTPDNAHNKYQWSATDALKQFTDPSAESTTTDSDLIGRPILRVYHDGTRETYEWDGPRLLTYTDRQDRKQVFSYNALGQLETITDGTGAELDHLAYDAAGRIKSWKNASSLIEYLDFDLAGNPKTTRQTRYDDSGAVLDSFEQHHTWNAHGERTSWTMPRYAGFAPVAGWTDTVFEDHDAAGNVATIARTQFGGATTPSLLMSAAFRNSGRPDSRTVTTNCLGSAACSAATIVRSYGYDATTGQLNELRVTSRGLEVAGSHIGYDGLQINAMNLLGVSAGVRNNRFGYDDRSRLKAAVYGTSDPNALPAPNAPGTIAPQYTAADFLGGLDHRPKLDAATRTVLAAKNINVNAIDPTSMTATETAGGHKIATVTQNGQTRTFLHAKSERTDDGRFIYVWDEKGRLRSATEKPATSGQTIRRTRFFFDGRDRMIGRRSENAIATTPTTPLDTLSWQLETRPQFLAADRLPADVTLAWDPFSDNLVELWRAGSSATTDPNGGLLKQIVHGGLSYDDPIEVTMAASTTNGAPQLSPGGSVARLYPIFDEAGDGGIQTTLNVNGEVTARNVPGDSFGAEAGDLTGAAIDKVAIKATRGTDGTLTSVDVTVRSTEALTASTVATGLRLTTVDNTGAVVRSAPVTPVLSDPFTARFTLTAAQWATLTDATPLTPTSPAPQSLSIGVTNTLRAAAWSQSLPVLPPPDWAKATKPVYSTATLPVEVRESLTSLATFTVTGSTTPSSTSQDRTLYEIDSLTLAATPAGGGTGSAAGTTLDAASARFQALPFYEPMTGLIYARNRWYDPKTGSWLTPDPLGYQDSANLYAFAGGDPVNGRDPSGRAAAISISGTINGITPAGQKYRYTREYARAHPREVQRMLDTDSDLSADDVENLMATAGLPLVADAIGCLPGESCISSAVVLAPRHLPKAGLRGCAEGLFIEAAGLPATTSEGELCGGGERIVVAAASAGIGAYGGIKQKNTGRVSGEPYVPVMGGDLPVRVTAKMPINYPVSPIPEILEPLQGSYIDPLTDTRIFTSDTLQGDHIYAQSRIKAEPGFNRLSPEQQNAILNDPWNFEALPGSFNASKRDKQASDWTKYKGRPLDPNYIARHVAMEEILIRRVRAQIAKFLAGGS
jgi:RHS repeat-associated protein